MDAGIDIWRLAAGLGLFLFGMHQLEQSLRLLAGRSFKKFLREHTSRPIQGVIAGALSTAALQSSSVVSLIVLAFVGTGVISLASAIGIVFGSNLGTTATGWIVATIGFKLDIEALALPLIALGGFGVVWSRAGSRKAGFSHLATGLGLMLMGLEFMKSGAISATALFDPVALAAYPAIVYLLVGFVVTALIQSSSATIMITLSALYAGAIPLHSAAAVAIGADLGTTITALLGALAGSVDKKRVAVAIVLFNVVTDAIAFLALTPILFFVTDILGLSDPLFALVAFHSTFNLLGIVMFLPLVGLLSRKLAQSFYAKDESVLRHIHKTDIAVPEAAVENVHRDTLRLIDQSAALNLMSFNLPTAKSFYDGEEDRERVPLFAPGAEHTAGYAAVKQLEGEILSFALQLQSQQLERDESERLSQVIPAIRNAVHAAKCLKDTHHDLDAFRQSADDRFNAWFERFASFVGEFYDVISRLKNAETSSHRFEILVSAKNCNEGLHAAVHADIYREVSVGHLDEVQISTLLNVNREIYASNQSMTSALADAVLDIQGASDFESIPVSN